ncbi:SAM-dependent methyltransferase [Flavobacterium aciduliphilum]|uniref:Methyltransferase family protein n=1 Tax=Flavobacterium aciduliphilum TaxID=1101402 RepID=A0A328YQB5_9FLAO|nr:methyltransferase domain-containing protein [Flavobacterium aciduliphilum]RAR75333.1 methyltransferase family protein [Flavobacterium aciduliphilum]
MKKLDYFIQKQRLLQAEQYIIGDSILDIGCHHGELFEHLLKKRPIFGDGIDSVLETQKTTSNYTLYPGYFPSDFPEEKQYHNITLLAVLEHIPIQEIEHYPRILSRFLKPKGRVIITIPSKQVDYILAILLFFKLVKGMDLEHHQDFERSLIKTIFTAHDFKLMKEKKFEFGLNTLYVFEKK